MRCTSTRALLRLAVLPVVAAALLAGLLAPASATSAAPITLKLLSISDWHAQLDRSGGVGGAAALATYFANERAAEPDTLTFTAGDAFAGSPPLSGFFNEEPAVKAMNLAGFTADTLGNHNLDRGVAHMRAMTDLAQFDYVSANLTNLHSELPNVRPYRIYEVAGVKVAVIGITNPEAPTLVKPGNFGTIEVTDPVNAANRARAQALRQGATVFVVLTHMGVTGTDPATGEPVGPLIDFANSVGGFDVILGDHTDVRFSGVVNNQLVVENRSRGLTYARTLLDVDPSSRRVTSAVAQFVTPTAAEVTPDPAVVAMLQPYRNALTAAYDGQIGTATDLFPRSGNIERLREVALGNLVTDAMRLRYGTQLTITNGGGLRAPLPSSYSPRDTNLRRTSSGYEPGPPYDLVVGDVFTVLPFGNQVLTRTVTGQQLYRVLEHGVAAMPFANGRFPQVSGFRFT